MTFFCLIRNNYYQKNPLNLRQFLFGAKYSEAGCSGSKTNIWAQKMLGEDDLNDEYICFCHTICAIQTWLRGYKTFFMLNSTEHEITTAMFIKTKIPTNKEVSFLLQVSQMYYLSWNANNYWHFRALTPLFRNGAEAHGIGKISDILTKIGKLDIVLNDLMYDVYIARLIPIFKLTLVYYEKREGKKQVFFIFYEIKIENHKKIFFLSNWEFFVWNWEKTILFGIGNGAEFRPLNRVIESPAF